MLRAVIFFFFMILPGATLAQDRPSAILVLDASGSMWGQIAGVNKIVIARDVVSDLLGTLPEDQALGLVAYGHRRKGDCNDIELLYEPGTDRGAISDAVMTLNPKGKTPLSAAVLQAAEALRYTEDTATVILVSDGIETCDYDPCEVGRQLEETGVNFTAHVIGFDVADPAAQAQLQCLAEETGGLYRSAGDAGELSDALAEVAVATPEPAPEPEPILASVTFRATNGQNGPEEVEGILWDISAGDASLAQALDTPRPDFEIAAETTGRATATRISDGATATISFTTKPADMIVTVALPVFVPPATVEAPESAPAGSMVPVTFTGPGNDSDFLASATDEQRDGFYTHYTYTREAEDNVVMLRMPPEPGVAEIRYMLQDGSQVIARTEIEVTPLSITLTPPTKRPLACRPQSSGSGPDYDGDYITVAGLDQRDPYYQTYAYTRDGAPLAIQMPPEPGTYELRYVLGASRAVAARSVPFEVGDSPVTLSAPAEVTAGSTLDVTWRGPDADNDYIGIGPADGSREYDTYTYTREGNPLPVMAPAVPGDYEIRYFLGQDRSVLASIPLKVTDVTATLAAEDSTVAGSSVSVTWSGPGYRDDYLTISRVDSDDDAYESYTYTREGSPLDIVAPIEPGTYEIRYVMSQDRRVIARRALTVTAVTASIEAPPSAIGGQEVLVTWTGPDYRDDFLAASIAGSDDGDYVTYAYTRDGSPLRLEMPTDGGSYEIRYVARNDRTVLARTTIEVETASASMEAPDSAPAGSIVDVTWTGPDTRRDYLSVALPDDDANRYADYAYSENGNPAEMKMPTDPGTYELRYVQAGQPTKIIGTRQITITEVAASLQAELGAESLDVTWEGPGYDRDYIALAQPGQPPNRYETYAYARNGSPASLRLPDAPSTYELRYILAGSTDRILATLTITIP